MTISLNLPLVAGICSLAALLCLQQSASAAPNSRLELTSSSRYLVDAFNRSKAKALSWVQTGAKPGYIPCYWAGYKSREAFYERDIAHQCEGAALLGLNEENFSMWQAFAATATPERKYYSLWALDFYGKPYAIDYRDDNWFVREIPAPLEMVDKACACYRWSGDARWIKDPILQKYYDTTTSLFIDLHDENGDGIPEEHSTEIFLGCASYNEWGVGLGQAADGVACQWAAYNSYASLLRYQGSRKKSASMDDKAAKLRNAFTSKWWNPSADNYFAGLDLKLEKWIPDFGKEVHTFLAVKGLAEPGPRANALLDKMHRVYAKNLHDWNFEAYTYLPESFYNYGQNDRGWFWLKKLLDSRYDYPEISFTAVEFVATGLMGIEPDAPKDRITTLGRLTPEVDWVQLDHIPLGQHDVLVRHEAGNTVTTLEHHSGSKPLTWEAQFPGTHSTVYIDGRPRAAKEKVVNGVAVTYATVSVPGGSRKTLSVAPGRQSVR